MTPIDWLRKLWFETLLRAPFVGGERIGGCRKFVPNPRPPLSNIYCRVCGYDTDMHQREAP